MSGFEAAGLAIGAVSLFFQAFSGCVQGYELVIDACHLEVDCQALLVKLKVEEHRLLNWGKLVGLDYTDESLKLNHMSRGLVLDVLYQQKLLFQSFTKIGNKYKKKFVLPTRPEPSEPFVFSPQRLIESVIGTNGNKPSAAEGKSVRFPPTQELVRKSFDYLVHIKDVPARLQWSSHHKEKMEDLIAKLADFNDKMNEALSQGQMEVSLNMQRRTQYEILVLNRNMETLKQIIQSQMITSRPQHLVTDFEITEYDELSNGSGPSRLAIQPFGALAQRKAVNLAIEDSTVDFTPDFARSLEMVQPEEASTQIRKTELSIMDMRPRKGGDKTPQADSVFDMDDDNGERTEAFFRNTPVWVEWKTADPAPGQDGLNSMIEERVKKLTALLKKNSRTDKDIGSLRLRAPQCVGYFPDIENGRFGIVFEKPDGVSSIEAPVSLYELLSEATASEDAIVPSLTTRVDLMRLLAETIERLHAVDWLHKGLRSENILFFPKPDSHEINFADPYISGFDYSRPAGRDDMTERPSEDLAADLYRHPVIQRDGGKGVFSKSHDLYSLGVVLFEIAYWQPLDQILKINVATARPKDAYLVRNRLLEAEPKLLRNVRSYQGDTVESIIRACLVGPEAFELGKDFDERSDDAGAALQRAFGEQVVARLEQMRGL